jgi:ligand-binding sensor domain-containing protein
MQLDKKLIAAIAVVTVGVVAGIYAMNTQQPEQPKTETAQQQGSGLPSGHPPLGKDASLTGKVKTDPNAKFTRFGVGNNNIKSIFIDGKVAWIGTSGGVIRYDTGTDEYRMFNVSNGLLSNGVFNISKLGDNIAVGTYGGGLSLYDQKQDKWENLNVPNGLADAFIYKTLKASNGDIWIATWSGANRVRGGDLKDRSKWDVYTVENTKGGLPNDWVYSLEEGKNGEIWLATEGGLARFKDDKWQNWNHAKGVGAPFEKIKNDPQFGVDPANFSEHHAKQKKEMGLGDTGVAFNPNYIVSMTVDRDGVVWCGTWGGGLSRYDGKKWRHYTMADGLPGNHVFMLHLDTAGKLWVGTNNGVARFENGKFSNLLTTDNGLFSNTVFSMATGPDGSQWIGSFGGVTHLTATK